MSSRNYYHLPDLHALCPWKAAFNPHNDAVGHASREWVLSYPHDAEQAMDKLKFFEQCGPELLASWGYPYAGPEELRTCCDFVNLLFTIDEISDLQNGKEAATTATCVIRSMTEDDYDDGSILCHMTRESVSFPTILLPLSSDNACVAEQLQGALCHARRTSYGPPLH